MSANELKVVCGCAAQEDERKAVAVDPSIKSSNLVRLRRIEGQIRGLQKMVEEDRYCADILVQISAVHEALRGVSKSLMLNHLKHCTTEALRSGDEQKSAEVYDELMALIFKHSR
jgi:DNA-binding FrmR family transcriptional regulator